MKLPSKFTLPCFAILMALTFFSTDLMAQRGGQRGGPQRGGGQADESQLLRSEEVRKELDFTEDQLKELEALNSDRGGMDREKMRAELEGLSDEDRMEKMRSMRDERTAERKKQIETVLLPHQIDRLKQLMLQYAARNGFDSPAGSCPF